MSRVRHLILDRDGVLNVEMPDRGYVLHPSQWRWLPGVLPALASIRGSVARLTIATNQSAVGRGLLSRADLDAIHARLQRDADRHGVRFDGIFVCPHAPMEGCPCRKPEPGLLRAAMREGGVAPEHTVFVGDAATDLEAARRAGIAGWLVRTGKGAQTERDEVEVTAVFDDLAQVARELERRTMDPGER